MDDDDDDVEVVVIMDRLVSCTYDVTDLFHGIYSHSRRCIEREYDRTMIGVDQRMKVRYRIRPFINIYYVDQDN